MEKTNRILRYTPNMALEKVDETPKKTEEKNWEENEKTDPQFRRTADEKTAQHGL